MSSLIKVACISLHIIVLFYLPCFYPYCSRSGTFFNKFLNILQPLQQHSLFTVIIKETRQFELLNYSEHGTIVDNVLYSCDFSEKPKQHSNNHVTSSNAKFDTTSKYMDMQQHRRKKPPIGRTTRGLGTEFITRACNCRASASSLIGGSGAGWEGTAVLHHGSYVKFGCLHFVFSIVDCATTATVETPVKRSQDVSQTDGSKRPIPNIAKEILSK